MSRLYSTVIEPTEIFLSQGKTESFGDMGEIADNEAKIWDIILSEPRKYIKLNTLPIAKSQGEWEEAAAEGLHIAEPLGQHPNDKDYIIVN